MRLGLPHAVVSFVTLAIVAACTAFGAEGTNAPADAGADVFDDVPDADAAKDADAAQPNVRRRVVFVTSETWVGSLLGGVDGADAKCQARAVEAGAPSIRGRPFVAWLSAPGTSAGSRVAETGDGIFVRPDDVRIADGLAELLGGKLDVEIDVDENSDVVTSNGVWTGTLLDGGGASDTCDGWVANVQGMLGKTVARDPSWTASAPSPCGSTYEHLYCFER
jgi:hypothetical protein